MSNRTEQSSAEKRALLEQLLRKKISQPRYAPLSFAQGRLWFLEQIAPGDTAYHVPLALQLSGELQIEALSWSLSQIVARHEALRTTFVLRDDQPVQQINPPAPVALPIVPVDASDPSAVDQALRSMTRQPFDLQHGPLLRATLLRLADDEHILLLVLHHIVADGWSTGVLLRELTTLYTARYAGQPNPLAPLPIQYADYAVWERDVLSEERLAAQRAYWAQQLAGAPAVLTLPTDRPRPPVQTSHGATYRARLPQALVAELEALSQQEGATLFQTLLAAFQVLLGRLARQSDVVVGTPIAHRTRRETEALIGCFINTLALRADLSGNPSFRALLQQVRATTLAAYEQQDLPFEQVVDVLQLARDLSYTPLFQTLFVVWNTQSERLDLPGLRSNIRKFDAGVTQFDLILAIDADPQGLEVVVEYSTDLFDATTIARVIDCWRQLLAGVVANPAQPIAALPLLTAADRQTLLAFNPPATPDAAATCLHHAFAAQAARTPDAIAVTAGPTTLRYGALEARANQLAHQLRALGVGPDTLVGLYVERSAALVVALLATLKAGAAYLPLDPSYPAERLQFMAADAGVRVVLTETALQATAPTGPTTVLALDAWDGAAWPTTPPAVAVTPDHLAYVIYTSGSTGTPKGVMISHRAIVNHMQWLQSVLALTPDDRVLQKTAFSFDASVSEFFAPLLAGAQLVMAAPGAHRDSSYLAQALIEHQITALQVVPSLLRVLVDDGAISACASLRQVFCAGEALTAELHNRFLASTDARLYNFYGPTEAAIDATWRPCVSAATDSVIPIGRPISNMQVYVLDEQQNMVPVGVGGELYIGGAGLAQGYLNRPALTAARFVPDPFSTEPGARLYRSGDLARWLPDGELEYLGRIDQQVKLRGFRIELGEIEAALQQHPDVRSAAVIVHAHRPDDLRLAAYVVPEVRDQGSGVREEPVDPSSFILHPSSLRSFLAQSLPEYMLPSAFIMLPTLPLTANGKLDRNALPAPDSARPELTDAYVAPRTSVETALAEIWAAVLGVARVGIHDNFFALGGHSLLATQVVTRVRELYQIELPLRQIFEQGTIAGLAEQIAASTAERGATPDQPIERVSRDQALPLSFEQYQLWFLDQVEPGTSAYNVPMALQLSGALDLNALRRSLTEIIERHEILRTTIGRKDGRPVQLIQPAPSMSLPVVSIDGADLAARRAAAQELVQTEAERPFDLQHGPLLRATLLRLADDEHILLLVLHHIVSDEWSMAVLFQELTTLYQSYSAQLRSALPALPVQYADYAAWQRTALNEERLAAQRAYWAQQLAGAPAVLTLPTDRPRPPVQTSNGGDLRFELSPQLAAELEALSRQEGATLFQTLLAAFQVLLGRLARQSDVVVGTPIAHRTRRETEALIGCFINTLALRADLSGNPSFRALLQQVRATTLAAYEQQDLPFAQVVDALQLARDLSYTPLFQALFDLHNVSRSRLDLPGLAIRPLNIKSTASKFDLSLWLEQTDQGLSGGIEYNRDLFDAATIERVIGCWRQLLAGIVANPAQPIHALPLLPEDERHELLITRNLTAAEYPATACFHDLFAAQAARTPDAAAVIYGSTELSYRELDRRANQLANSLRARGVGPGVCVGICMERAPEMVIALLGVLKAGAAFMPLEPTFPSERIAYMLDDARAAIVLTQAHLREALAEHAVTMLCLDADWPIYAAESDQPLVTGATGADLAYVIYTSGSTGRPKGVLIPHQGLVNYLVWAIDAYTATAGRGAPVHSTIAADAIFPSLFVPLLVGRSVVLLPEMRALDALAAELSERGRFSLVKITPSQLEVLNQQLPQRDANGWVRTLVVGAEALRGNILSFWRQYAPETTILNEYGPTETVVGCSMYEVPKQTAIDGAVPIGLPIANLTFYVLDAYLQPVPIGVAGELFIGGDGVAWGYLNRPALTADKFIPDPFSRQPGARLYRTGDLVRYLPDRAANIEFMGRIDQQVKIRGFRVEPGEIETALVQHPAVREAVVLYRTEAPAAPRLVAYCVPQTTAPALDALRAFLAQRLPEYMVPAAFVFLAELPLTANGKLNRNALPAPDGARPELADAYVAPRTPVETALAEMWASVLGLDRVGIHDHFFALGGHSLLATVLISQIRDVFRVELPLRALFEAATVAELAVALVAHERKPGQVRRTAELLQRLNSMSADQISTSLDQRKHTEGTR